MKDYSAATYLLGTVIKCFLVLVFFGIVLPKLIDYLLVYLYKESGNIYNSIFVNKNYNNKNFIDNYIHLFRKFVTL